METELKTPLYDCHVEAGGKIVPFAGYLLPVQYETGVVTEHMAVREKAGLFDVSHMGEVTFKGPDALANIQNLMANDYSDLQPGFARYSPMCYDNGGCVDDLIVYMFAENDYMVVVNAANRHKDFAWMKEHVTGNCQIEDISDSVAQLALQGPLAPQIIAKITPEADIPQGNYTFVHHANVGGMDVILSRTGYTGEDGFEIYMPSEQAPKMFKLLLETGKDDGLIPCGLGARDTLRMEAAMPLYGHEMDETVTPLEAGLKIFTKLDKDHFIGKPALDAIADSTPRLRIGLKVTGRGIIREHCDVYVGDKKIGVTTSGTHAPYVGCPIAMALVNRADKIEVGEKCEVDVRGRRVEAERVKLPFYKRAK